MLGLETQTLDVNLLAGIVKKLKKIVGVITYVETNVDVDSVLVVVNVHRVQIIAMMVIKAGHYALTMHRTWLFLLT